MKPTAEFSLGLGEINPLSVDPCNVIRGKTFKLIRGEDNEEKTAVIDAETQKTVAVLRRELQREKLRSFVDLTKQRAKIVTVGGNSSTTETNEHQKQQHQQQQLAAAAVTNSSRLELPMKIKTKNPFEVAIAKIEKNNEIFKGRILLS